jgi:hypothetical protein
MIGAIIGSIVTSLVLAKLNLRKMGGPLGIFLGGVIVFFGCKMLFTI